MKQSKYNYYFIFKNVIGFIDSTPVPSLCPMKLQPPCGEKIWLR